MGGEAGRSDRARVYHYSLAIWLSLILLYVALRSWRLTSYGLWVDEIFSVRAAQLAWPDLFRAVAGDAVHPPLFYVLLKLWITAGGATLLWVKLLPLMLSIAAVVPFWLLCQELRLDLTEATLAGWLMAVNGYLIHYSQELRMYSLLFCLSLWSLWLCFRLLSAASASLRVVVPLFVVNVLAVYTHYFGWLLVGTEWLCVLLWRPSLLGWFSVSVSGVTLAFAPWVCAVATSAAKVNIVPGSLQWIARPGWAEVIWYLATLNGIVPWRHTTPLGILLFGAPIAFALCRLLRSRQLASGRSLERLAVLSFVPMAVSFVASRLLPQSVWGERHLIGVAVPYLLMVAGAVSYVGRVSVRIALIVLIVTWSGVAGVVGLLREEGRIPWKSLAQHMIDEEAPSHRTVKVYAFEGWTAVPLDFLLTALPNRQFEVVVSEPSLMNGGRFWVVFRDPTLWVHGDPRGVLEQRGCRIDAERSAHDGGQRVIVLRATC